MISDLKKKIGTRNWTDAYERKLTAVHESINANREKAESGLFKATFVSLDS